MTPLAASSWPELPLREWLPTRDTLHMWTQIAGKTLLAACPPQNHWWHTTLLVSARGLASRPALDGGRSFELEFDLVDHQLTVRVSDGRSRSLPLEPRSVRDFYREYMSLLASLGIDVPIWTTPVEVPDPIPFDEDDVHHEYDRAAARRFWEVLRRCDAGFRTFGDGWLGKQSPVHFFWGSFDLAVTRFSGRRAPVHPGGSPLVADFVTREAYSHEVISCGFWPGGGAVPEPAFYAYAYPEPAGFKAAQVRPPQAFYSREFGGPNDDWIPELIFGLDFEHKFNESTRFFTEGSGKDERKYKQRVESHEFQYSIRDAVTGEELEANVMRQENAGAREEDKGFLDTVLGDAVKGLVEDLVGVESAHRKALIRDFVATLRLHPEKRMMGLFEEKEIPELKEGVELARKGEWRGAIARFQAGAESHPRSDALHKAYFNLGVAFEYDHEFDKALTSLRLADQLAPHEGYASEIEHCKWFARQYRWQQKYVGSFSNAVE